MSAARSSDGPAGAAQPPHRRAVALWLLLICALIFAMVVLGGVTRLTHSGLSMVQWRPVTGWLPPLSEAEWQAAFDQYKLYPEFQKINAGMTLAGYQSIFWLEYFHRLLGRLVGLAFAVPMLVFWLRGWVTRRLRTHLLVMLVLGGLQGALGWIMVQSGMVDIPDVSHVRLTVHLAAATVLYLYILWIALGLLLPPAPVGAQTAAPRAWRVAMACCFLMALVTFVSGGLVAGLNAGFVFNDFPFMAGRLVPDGLFALSPRWSNMLDNVITVQFQHRALALLTWAALCVAWWRGRFARGMLTAAVRGALTTSAAAACLQVCLGILTLWLHVPAVVAATHQACGLVLLTMLAWTLHEMRRAVV